jgi:hypothetical protein
LRFKPSSIQGVQFHTLGRAIPVKKVGKWKAERGYDPLVFVDSIGCNVVFSRRGRLVV